MPAPLPPRSRRIRRAALGVAIAAFVAVAIVLWRANVVTAGGVRRWLDSLGAVAPVLFLCAFALGSLVGMPGMAFVVGGRLAFGPWLGFSLGYAGGLLAVLLPFFTARALRRPAAEPWRPRHRWTRRAFDLLESHPVTAVILLRLFLWFNPALSYALALAPIRARDYGAACAVALVPVVAGAIVASGWFL